MTIKQLMQSAADFGRPYYRVVVIDGKKVKADYKTPEEVGKLASGVYFDSCLETLFHHDVGDALIVAVDRTALPIQPINSLMSSKRRKWLSYTVTHNGVTVTLANGSKVTGKDFKELNDKLQ